MSSTGWWGRAEVRPFYCGGSILWRFGSIFGKAPKRLMAQHNWDQPWTKDSHASNSHTVLVILETSKADCAEHQLRIKQYCTGCPLPVQSALSGWHVQVSFYGGLPAFEPVRSPEDQGSERGSESYAGNLQVISMDQYGWWCWMCLYQSFLVVLHALVCNEQKMLQLVSLVMTCAGMHTGIYCGYALDPL